MAKAVAIAQGWTYETHADFSTVLYEARRLTGNASLSGLRSIANELHFNDYRRKRHLNPDAIGEDLESIAQMVAILQPLTGLDN